MDYSTNFLIAIGIVSVILNVAQGFRIYFLQRIKKWDAETFAYNQETIQTLKNLIESHKKIDRYNKDLLFIYKQKVDNKELQ